MNTPGGSVNSGKVREVTKLAANPGEIPAAISTASIAPAEDPMTEA